MSDIRSILLIRLKSIGDIVLTLPAVHLVHDHFPQAKVCFLTSEEHTPILRGFSEVNEVLGIDRALYRRKNPKAIWTATFELVRRLRQERFSLVVDFQGYGETALLTWLTRAPQRWGSVHRPARRWAYTHGLVRDSGQHAAHWNLTLLTRCGLPAMTVRNQFDLPENDLQSARVVFAECGYDLSRPTLFIQPFTSAPHKNWPLEKHLALARHWRERGTQVIFGGGPADHEALGAARALGFPVAAGAPLLTTAGLTKLSTLVVGGDTGLLHLAVALGKRVIMLMRHTKRGASTPFGHEDWVLAPRGTAAVADIEVPELIAATAAAFHECGAPVHARV